MHFLSVSPSSQNSVSCTRAAYFVTLTHASLPYFSKIRENGSIFTVDYGLAILRSSILLNLTVTQSGRYYYYYFFPAMRKEAQNV